MYNEFKLTQFNIKIFDTIFDTTKNKNAVNVLFTAFYVFDSSPTGNRTQIYGLGNRYSIR